MAVAWFRRFFGVPSDQLERLIERREPGTLAAWTITGRESLLSLLGKRLARTRLLTRTVMALILRLVLVIAGLGLLSAAAWTIALPLGLAAAGVSCLVLEWAVKR